MCDTIKAYYNQFWEGNECVPSGYSGKYEYCMVFQLDEDGVDPKTGDKCYKQSVFSKQCVTLMLQQGLTLFLYNSCQGDEMYVLITASDELLSKYAQQINFKLQLDEKRAEALMVAGNELKEIAPVHIKNDKTITPLTPYEFIFGKFENKAYQSLYKVQDGASSPFSPQVRRKLVYYIIQGPLRDGGCDIEISRLLLLGKMTGFFPLHQSNELIALTDGCRKLTVMPWAQPLDDIRTYFGEKYAMYNAFLGHFTWCLIPPAFFGIICQLVVWSDNNNFSHPIMPFFAIVICLWSVSMLETWKGKQCHHALSWGMIGFESDEPDRPEFLGVDTTSTINGGKVTYFPDFEYFKRFTISIFSILAFILLVVGIVIGIYIMRFILLGNAHDQGSQSAISTLASVLNTVQITIFNIIYQKTVVFLTNLENHRTDTQYEDSLIAKLFAFQFVNSYASFFYLAFAAPFLTPPKGTPIEFLGQCGATTCMEPLAINLGIQFGTRLLLTNFLELLFPLMGFTDKFKAETKDDFGGLQVKKPSPPEFEYARLTYDSMKSSIANYADTTIQFGYMCLFIAALPVACFFSIISCYVKLRVNATNMKRFYQRPIPLGAEDIGSWQGIFTIMAVLSVITNAAIVCFTMVSPSSEHYSVLLSLSKNRSYQSLSDRTPPVGDISLSTKLWVFIIFQWILIFIQYMLVNTIPDVPDAVSIQQKREEFIVSKLINFVPDDDFDKAFGDELSDDAIRDLTSGSTGSSKKRESMSANKALIKASETICCCLYQPEKKSPKIRDVDDESYAIAEYPQDETTTLLKTLSFADAKLSKSSKEALKKKKSKKEKKANGGGGDVSSGVSSGSVNIEV